MFTITIENLLRFHEYFDDKMISMKNFPLDFEKVRSTHIYLVASLHKCGKTWKRKDRANILCHLESCHVASKCLAHSRSSPSKNVIGITQILFDPGLCCSKTAEENEENIKLNVSPNRQNIK